MNETVSASTTRNNGVYAFVPDSYEPPNLPYLDDELVVDFYNDEACRKLGRGTFGASYRVTGWLLDNYNTSFSRYYKRGSQPCCVKVFGKGWTPMGDASGELSYDALERACREEYDHLVRANGANGHTPRAIARGTVDFGYCDDSGKFHSEYTRYPALVMEYFPVNESSTFRLLGEELPKDEKGRRIYYVRNYIVAGKGDDGVQIKPSPSQAAVFALELCRAVLDLHERADPHRDLKPENIAVEIDDISVFSPIDRRKSDAIHTEAYRLKSIKRVYLLDLGSMASRDRSATVTSIAHAHMGTPPYAAPELFDIGLFLNSNEEQIGKYWKHRGEPSTDVFSIGCLIYWFIEGTDPCFQSGYIEEYDKNLIDNYYRYEYMWPKHDGLRLMPRNADTINAIIQPERELALEQMLCDFVEKCTLYNPEDRIKAISVASMEQQLSEALGLESAVSISTKFMGNYPTEVLRHDSRVRQNTTGFRTKQKLEDEEHGTRTPKHFRTNLADNTAPHTEEKVASEEELRQSSSIKDGRYEYVQASRLTDTHPQEAADLLRQSFAKGYVEAYAALGDILATEKVKPINADEAKGALLAAGRNRNAYAMYKLGEWFETGKNLGRVSDVDAMACYSVATDLGDTDAAFELGRMFLEAGKATKDSAQKQDYWDEAHKLFARICKDNPYGYLGLGWIYEYGYGVRVNNTTARRMYRAAANVDEPVKEACEKLAWPQGTVPRALARVSWRLLTCGPAVLFTSYFTLLWIGITAVVDTHASALATYEKSGFWLFWGVLEVLPSVATFLNCHIGRYGTYRVNIVVRLFCVVSIGICMYALWNAGLLPFLPSDMIAGILGVIVGLILQLASR